MLDHAMAELALRDEVSFGQGLPALSSGADCLADATFHFRFPWLGIFVM